MQRLYDAIMALGRSADDARGGGWICGELGARSGPKCVNGLVTWHLGSDRPTYLAQMESPEGRESAIIAGRALLRCVPNEVVEEMSKQQDNYSESLRNLREQDSLKDAKVEDVLVSINDLRETPASEFDDEGPPFLNGESAAQWFLAGLDQLATQLPKPIGGK